MHPVDSEIEQNILKVFILLFVIPYQVYQMDVNNYTSYINIYICEDLPNKNSILVQYSLLLCIFQYLTAINLMSRSR